MPIALTLYIVESPDSFESIRERFSEIDDVETTPNETELRTWAGSVEEISHDIFYVPLHYQNEIYFKIEGEDTWLVTDESIGIAFIGPTNMIAFAPRSPRGNRIANILNRILFGTETRIRNHSFSEDFMLEFMIQNPHNAPNIYLDDITLPYTHGSSIVGSDAKKSILYTQALDYGGRHGWMQLSLISERITIGLSKRKGTIVFYHKIGYDDMLRFIRDKILPLL